MNKGIVMEISESNIIVMTSGGRFDKLSRGSRTCEVGEEILYADVKLRPKVRPLAIGSGLVAAMVLCFVLITGLSGTTASGEVVAYISIDINPSVEIGIDNQEVVQDLQGLNTDGINLIASMSYKGKKLEDVTSDILDKAEQGALAKGEGDIVISSTVVQGKAKINDEAIAEKLKQQVMKHIEDAHPTQVKNYEVTAFAAPQTVRDEAKASGVSAGKYAVYLNALNNGTKVSLDDIQNISIHQLAKDNGGISSLINPAQPITKSTLKTLLEDEKSGKLAEKIQEKDDSNSKTDKTNSSNKNNKNNENNGKDNNNTSGNGKNNAGKNDKNSNSNNDNKNDSNKNDNSRGDSKDINKKDNKNENNRNDKNGNDNNRDNNKKDNKKDDGNKKDDPVSSSKPVTTLRPSQTSSPTPIPGVGSDSGSNPDGIKDKKKQEGKGKENSKKEETKPKKEDH